jgi:hypothetical protein
MAAVEPSGVSHSTAITVALGGVTALAATGVMALAGETSIAALTGRAVMPPAARRCDRPPCSHNKKTLEALTAAAAAEPSGVSHSTAITVAPGGVTALAATGVMAPTGATSIATLTGTSLEAAAALVGAVMAVGAAPPGLASRSVGGSSSTAAGKARKPWHLLPEQRLSYTMKHGYTTAMVHLLDGCQDRLPLPASFVGMMGKNPLTSIMVEEGSSGQPLYLVEILHDKQGKSYLNEG